ncbi:MAG: GTP cyclohydrolase II [Deltaproteobacteria bacterium]|nr:MAG: GTP cyclohydrolase II [Deltaproteobacteria bacterium]
MPTIDRYAEADMPTARGPFRLVVYRAGGDEHVAMVRGDVFGADRVLVRVHSECLTGETLGSLRCDCRAQLETALDRIAGEEQGILVYMRQEGRGIGLGNKVRAYALQDQGIDTVDANLALGFEADLRTYEIAAAILKDLGVRSVRLMTNNPDKVRGLEQAGVVVAEQVPHWVDTTEYSRAYVEAKKTRLGHIDGDTESK